MKFGVNCFEGSTLQEAAMQLNAWLDQHGANCEIIAVSHSEWGNMNVYIEAETEYRFASVMLVWRSL